MSNPFHEFADYMYGKRLTYSGGPCDGKECQLLLAEGAEAVVGPFPAEEGATRFAKYSRAGNVLLFMGFAR